MKSFGKKKILFVLAIIALLATGGAWYYYDQVLPAQADSSAQTIKTTRVRRGNLVISASGSGTLVAAAEANLGFRTAGLLHKVTVEVGDWVEAGDVLARLDDTDARYQVSQAEINLRLAELQLARLTAEPDAADLAAAQANLAAAQADLDRLTTPPAAQDLAAARENLHSAQEAMDALLASPTPEEITIAQADLQLAEITLQGAQADYDVVAGWTDVGATPQAVALWQATTAYEKAKATYDLKVAGPTDEQIVAAQAQVTLAEAQLADLERGTDAEDLIATQAKVTQAQAQLDTLLAGASAEDREAAQLAVEQARIILAQTQVQLEDTELRSPFAGTVTAVQASAGEMVGTTPIVTLANLAHPLVELYLDEADLDKITPGLEVEIILDALPDETFRGQVVRVEPELTLVEGVPTIQALAALDVGNLDNPQPLLAGLNASVEVISGRAEDVLLVPAEALRELSPGNYAVFVMVDGQPRSRPVEVGLMNFSYAEILTGLEQGDEVSTGIVETD